ncbi:hypothetical protein M0657_008902 [Pyricularia oryzae]|nr:hypothetical protein M0657_008902 [Pyricularia oryzae]KAI7917800.1 hypothetical protein M9X92_007219 [Pyricularia oryzae]
MANNMAAFSFFSFPPEIRHLIYEWMLCDFTAPRKVDPATFPDDMVRAPLKLGLENLSPAILRTSRQVHAEATAAMVRRCRFVHISAILDYWSIRSIVPRNLGVLCAERDLIQRFRGCVMALHVGSTASPYSREHRIDCLILGRDLDAYCRSLGSWVDVPPDFGRRTSLTLELGNPLNDPGPHVEFVHKALRVLQDIGTIPNIIRASWEPNSAQLAELYFRKANVCHFRSIWQEDPETSFDCMRQALVAITEATKYQPRFELIPKLQELKKSIRDDALKAVGDRLNFRGKYSLKNTR